MLKTLAGRRNTVFVGIMLVGMLVMLRWISIMNYLLFHSLAELFSIIVAVGIFMLYWNARDFVENNYFVFISIAYLFISLIDLVHTLAYKGMGVFPAYDANLPTQLWIAARYLESLSLFAAIFFLRRKISNRLILYIFAVIFILFLSAIFGGIFPDCFVEGIGLTPFKKISEYLISMVLMVTIVWLSQKKTHFDTGVFRFLIASLVTTIFAELSFTFYNDVTGFSNFIGHIFKIISFYMIYRALLQIGLTKPYAILFHYQKTREAELKQSEEKYYNLFTYANDSIFIIHPKTLHILDVNENAAKRLGYLKDEILQLTIPDIAPLKEVSHYQEISQNVQDQERVSFESIHRCKDGSEMPVEITSRAIEYSGHRVIQSIVRDISERIRAEEAIRIRDEMWRLVGEMALIGGWEFDADTLEGVWTEEVARIHDLDPDQETSVEFGVAFYQGESRSKIENAIREAVEIGKPYDLELEITTARGNHKWVRTIGQPKQKDGKVVLVQGVFQDITSSKQIALEREALHLKLQNYNSDLKQQVNERTDELESRII
ncbi:MAG: PAS domain S-box protein, partial [Chloroflexi bacterium]|nr:PAS domain S-box protein [Chloroflexota bacterium]